MYFMARLPWPWPREPRFGKQRQRSRGFVGIESRQRITDVDDDVVSQRDAVDQRKRDALAYAVDVDQRRIGLGQRDDLCR